MTKKLPCRSTFPCRAQDISLGFCLKADSWKISMLEIIAYQNHSPHPPGKKNTSLPFSTPQNLQYRYYNFWLRYSHFATAATARSLFLVLIFPGEISAHRKARPRGSTSSNWSKAASKRKKQARMNWKIRSIPSFMRWMENMEISVFFFEARMFGKMLFILFFGERWIKWTSLDSERAEEFHGASKCLEQWREGCSHFAPSYPMMTWRT